jgi:hypothetical protein
MHVYEVRPRKHHHGIDLISDALPFGRLWYVEPDAVSNAIGYAKHYSRSRHALTRVYDEIGNLIEDARARGRVQRVVIRRTNVRDFLRTFAQFSLDAAGSAHRAV